MRKRTIAWAACLLMSIAASFAEVNIIPKPTSITEQTGTFYLKDGLNIGTNDASLKPAAEYLQEMLTRATGLTIKAKGKKGKIQLTLLAPDENDESYELVSGKAGIQITAHSYRGIINGIATLRQLLPNEIESKNLVKDVEWKVPAVTVKDSPNFHWRGLMLDPVRHFYSIEETKQLLDDMALYKLNKFHWHLTDDQAYRIEIKKYPKLTEEGAWHPFNGLDRGCMDRAAKENNPSLLLPWKYIKNVDGQELYGGFYTQDEIREVVEYAAIRGIDIIPELDMPGHNSVACQCYPWLSCTNNGVDPLCLGRETTIEFAQNVYAEVFKLFPYEYVSIGGDEVNRTRWSQCPECQKRIEEQELKDVSELQAWFTKHMEQFFNAAGKRILGWDEILEGGLSKTATVHWWRGDHPDVTQRATAMGNEVVLCPFTFCYFDYGQDNNTLRHIYDGDIVPTDLTPEQLKLIKGMQANIWGEWIPTVARMHWQVFPRALALAEKAWTPRSEQKWDDFLPRLKSHLARLEAMGIQYRPLETSRP